MKAHIETLVLLAQAGDLGAHRALDLMADCVARHGKCPIVLSLKGSFVVCWGVRRGALVRLQIDTVVGLALAGDETAQYVRRARLPHDGQLTWVGC